MNKHYWLALLAVVSIALAGCSEPVGKLRMHLPKFGVIDQDTVKPLFEQQSGIGVSIAQLPPHLSGLDALLTGQADLALVENSSPFQPGIRAVLPAYKSVLHILIRDGVTLDEFPKPLRNRSIYIMNDSPAGKGFVSIAAERQKLTADELNIVSELEPGKTDVIIYFGPVASRSLGWYVPGYSLYSLEYENVAGAMSVKAIGYMLPHVEPEVIPAQTYDLPGNEVDIYTLSVDALLATRRVIPERIIYKLTKTVLQEKPRFEAIAPEIFSGINEKFDPLDLSFPLHSGARRYLERDEPSTLERYAETINLLAYLLFALLTGVFGLARLHSQRKKDRIDEFYSRIMAIRMRAMSEPHEPLLFELHQLELEAFESLIAEKLAADESFRIFIELLTRAIAELNVDTQSESSR